MSYLIRKTFEEVIYLWNIRISGIYIKIYTFLKTEIYHA